MCETNQSNIQQRKGRIAAFSLFVPDETDFPVCFDERLSKLLVSQEKISHIDDPVTEHGSAERRLGTNDCDCCSHASKSGSAQ